MDRDRIEELFAPFGPVTVKRMFGGHGIYADGLFFALETDGEIYLKADAETVVQFEAVGSRPFVYRGKNRPVTMSYGRLPDEALEDERELRRWAALALDAARRGREETPDGPTQIGAQRVRAHMFAGADASIVSQFH